mgnify:CR=1 FL=1|jgi:hypothetical protein
MVCFFITIILIQKMQLLIIVFEFKRVTGLSPLLLGTSTEKVKEIKNQ